VVMMVELAVFIGGDEGGVVWCGCREYRQKIWEALDVLREKVEAVEDGEVRIVSDGGDVVVRGVVAVWLLV
nr:hypothetical protein [Tanacetum cinerariifolium]